MFYYKSKQQFYEICNKWVIKISCKFIRQNIFTSIYNKNNELFPFSLQNVSTFSLFIAIIFSVTFSKPKKTFYWKILNILDSIVFQLLEFLWRLSTECHVDKSVHCYMKGFVLFFLSWQNIFLALNHQFLKSKALTFPPSTTHKNTNFLKSSSFHAVWKKSIHSFYTLNCMMKSKIACTTCQHNIEQTLFDPLSEIPWK